MAKLKLTMRCRPNERVLPIIDGTVDVEGVELVHTDSGSPISQFLEADVFELPLVSYLREREQGANLVLVPVFPLRDFFHVRVWRHANSGIKEPRDLAGKRLAVPENQPAGGMWALGTLEHDFGATNLSVVLVPADQSPAALLANREVDAAFLNRASDGEATPLFPDAMEEGTRYFKLHGFIPANYGYVIRGELYEKYPWLAFNFFKAFLEAKEVYKQRLPRSIPSGLIFGPQYLRNTQRIFGEDPFPSGLKANRDMLQTLLDYCQEQGLTKTKPSVDELVPVNIRDLDPGR